MAKFDEVLAELQAKLSAAMTVIAQYPDVAAEVRAAIGTAQSDAEIVEAAAQDDARANALNTVLSGVEDTLLQAESQA